MKPIRFLLALFVCSTTAAQSQTIVPHTFQNGAPSDATKVNENFDALAEAVAKASAGRFVVKSAGDVIGFAWGSGGFISEKGYSTYLNEYRGTITEKFIFFENETCSGDAYADSFGTFAGFVFHTGLQATGPVRYWAIPLDATLETVITRSAFGDGYCSATTPETQILPKAVPNDPETTGIQNKGASGNKYEWPITYEML